MFDHFRLELSPIVFFQFVGFGYKISSILLGMAGAGKTSFTRRLSTRVVDGSRPYLINLDPACREVSYPANIGKH